MQQPCAIPELCRARGASHGESVARREHRTTHAGPDHDPNRFERRHRADRGPELTVTTRSLSRARHCRPSAPNVAWPTDCGPARGTWGERGLENTCSGAPGEACLPRPRAGRLPASERALLRASGRGPAIAAARGSCVCRAPGGASGASPQPHASAQPPADSLSAAKTMPHPPYASDSIAPFGARSRLPALRQRTKGPPARGGRFKLALAAGCTELRRRGRAVSRCPPRREGCRETRRRLPSLQGALRWRATTPRGGVLVRRRPSLGRAKKGSASRDGNPRDKSDSAARPRRDTSFGPGTGQGFRKLSKRLLRTLPACAPRNDSLAAPRRADPWTALRIEWPSFNSGLSRRLGRFVPGSVSARVAFWDCGCLAWLSRASCPSVLASYGLNSPARSPRARPRVVLARSQRASAPALARLALAGWWH